MRSACVAAAAIAAAIAAAAAADAARAQDGYGCDRATTVEIAQCLAELYEREDAELNRVWRLAVSSIAAADHMGAADRDAWRTSLIGAQRAWVSFKDTDCGEVVRFEWWGGTGAGPASLACLIDRTRQRASELKDRYGVD